MRQKARKKLNVSTPDDLPDALPEEEKPPSLYNGFFYIFAGTTISSWFIAFGQTLLALAIGTPFILIGMKRMMKATSYKSRKSKLAV